MTLYEAATLPIGAPRMESLPLARLMDAELRMQTTLVVPPAIPMQRDHRMMERIRGLDEQTAAAAA